MPDTTEKLYVRALAAARQERDKKGVTPTKERLHALYGGANAPNGGWKSRVMASRRAYLEQIITRLKKKNVTFVDAKTVVYTMLPQKELDHIAELTHHETRKVSKGHVAWKVIHPEGLHEYFFVGDDLHRASHVHPIDAVTQKREKAVKLASGLLPSMALLDEHAVQVTIDHVKKHRKALEDLIWKKTHADHRGGRGMTRGVLMNMASGATLVPFSSMTIPYLRKLAGLTP